METFNVSSDKCINITTLPDDNPANNDRQFSVHLMTIDEEVVLIQGNDIATIIIESCVTIIIILNVIMITF